jgi:hypothetical protein
VPAAATELLAKLPHRQATAASDQPPPGPRDVRGGGACRLQPAHEDPVQELEACLPVGRFVELLDQQLAFGAEQLAEVDDAVGQLVHRQAQQ